MKTPAGMFYALGFIFVSGMMTDDYFESVVEIYDELSEKGLKP